jgi:hypothetical protein
MRQCRELVMTDIEIMNRSLHGTDSKPLVDSLNRMASDRKLRLFAVACCRSIWHLLPDKRSRNAVKIAERFADEIVDRNALIPAFDAVSYSMGKYSPAEAWVTAFAQCAAKAAAHACAKQAAIGAAKDVAEAVGWSAWAVAKQQGAEDTSFCQIRHAAFLKQLDVEAALLRDVAGDRVVTIDRPWQTPTVVTVAQAMYKERTFDCMPILADALAEAGCDNLEILTHCREPGMHVRGCWIIDLVLGKK